MNTIQPAQIAQFMKRFRFRGGALRRFRIRNHSAQHASGEVLLILRTADSGERVRLRLLFDGVEEFRFQRRPGPGLFRLKEVRLGYFGGLFFLNFDAFSSDEAPTLIDFRASDAFIAARTISWEIVPAKPGPTS
jgi:hypothetical protein